jgi:hypothetical protein
MSSTKVYTSFEDWWEDRKAVLKQDLSAAEKEVSDPEIVKIMQEILENIKVSTRISDYYNEQKPGE